jgi:thiamine biosynthesis lipoprotein
VRVFHRTFIAMHTRLSLVIPGSRADGALAHAIECHVVEHEQVMSRFGDGCLAEINAGAFAEAVRVPDALWDVLVQCRAHWQRTNGLFDAARGRMNEVVFDRDEKTVRFAAPDVVLDLGGIGKGIALKGVERLLREAGVSSALVSFGESSILAIGHHPAGAPWPVSLAEAPQTVLALQDRSLSVSGQGGRCHIIDPRRGEWAEGPALTAVVAPCPVDAEVLSTALLIAEPRERDEILARYPGAHLTIEETLHV